MLSWQVGRVKITRTHYAAPTAGHIHRDGDAFRFEL